MGQRTPRRHALRQVTLNSQRTPDRLLISYFLVILLFADLGAGMASYAVHEREHDARQD